MYDRALHNELYLQYAPIIYSRCRRFLRSDDEAQEAAGEVFRCLTHAWDGLREKGGALPWIHRTTARMRLAERKRVQVWILGNGQRSMERKAA